MTISAISFISMYSAFGCISHPSGTRLVVALKGRRSWPTPAAATGDYDRTARRQQPSGRFFGKKPRLQESETMILNRFTTIEKMLEIVQTETLLMSNPAYWEDKNDSSILEIYKNKRGLKSLFAVCFTKGAETIYHWGAFAIKSEACCIEIAGDELINDYRTNGFSAREVSYVQINEMKEKVKSIDQLPFVKRYPYRNEEEFRIIFESKKKHTRPTLAVPRAYIKKITINQHLPKEIFDLLNEKIERAWNIPVNRSTVIKNNRWINHMKKL